MSLSEAQVTWLTQGSPSDGCWESRRDCLLIELSGLLHDTAQVDDVLWSRLAWVFAESELLDLLLLAGWYRAISFAANVIGVALEDWALTFADTAAKAA